MNKKKNWFLRHKWLIIFMIAKRLKNGAGFGGWKSGTMLPLLHHFYQKQKNTGKHHENIENNIISFGNKETDLLSRKHKKYLKERMKMI